MSSFGVGELINSYTRNQPQGSPVTTLPSSSSVRPMTTLPLAGVPAQSNLPSSVPSNQTGGPSGIAPSATAGSQNADGTNPGGWDWSQALSGQAGYGATQTSQNYIYNPNANNYQIGGIPTYLGQQQGIGANYANTAYNAGQQGTNLANQAAAQNNAFQSGVNSSTQNFLNNAQGLGNYDSSLAGMGGDQQGQAYNAITQMAQGNGPSLAAKNLQAGLNQQNQAVHAASMSNQGLGGAGNASRNALNAQAANTNNELEAAQQGSVGEQIGALQQQSAAANNIRASNQAQASAASSAGLAQRSLNAGALQNQYSAQLAGNQAANNTQLGAYGLANQTQLGAYAGQAATSNNAFNANVAQQQANQSYDTALQNEGNTRAQINQNAVQSQAAQNAGVTGTLGNIIGGVGAAVSDQNMKTDIDQGTSVDSALNSILSLGGNGAQGAENTALASDISKPMPQLSSHISAWSMPASKNSGGGGGGGGLGGDIEDVAGGLEDLFSWL